MEPERIDRPEELEGQADDEVIEAEVVVTASESARSGIYSNFAQVSHDADGFTVDFFSLDPGDPPSGAMLQARIRVSHRMGIRVRDALSANILKWAVKEQSQREKEEVLLDQLVSEHDGLAATGEDERDA